MPSCVTRCYAVGAAVHRPAIRLVAARKHLRQLPVRRVQRAGAMLFVGQRQKVGA